MSFPTPEDQSSSLTCSAFMLASRFQEDTDNDVNSLPSESASNSSLGADIYSEDESESDADEEWQESMEQLEQLLSMVIIPFMGKFLGKKCAYWGRSVWPSIWMVAAKLFIGWNKFMEWKYPVEIVIGSTGLSEHSGKRKTAPSL